MSERHVDNLDSDYAAAGFRGQLGWGSTPAVLIVDVCDAYINPESPLYASVDAEVASMARLVAAARTANVPVIFTRVEYEPGGSNGGLFYKKVPALASFDRGSPWAAFPGWSRRAPPWSGALPKRIPEVFQRLITTSRV